MKGYLTLKNLSLISLLVVFTVDVPIPPGTAIGILYLATMILVFYESRKVIMQFAFLSSILIILDVVINIAYGKTDLPYSVYADRILSLFAVWLSCFKLLRYRKLSEEKSIQQDQLLKSEKLYHQLIDNLIDGAQIMDFDLRYKYVNNSAVKHSMFSREELINCTMMEKYPGIEKTELFKTLTRCMTSKKAEIFESEFIYPDNSVGYFKLSIEPIDTGLFILSMDISERKKKEANQKRYTMELEEMIHITSHKVRQPVTQILGLSSLIEKSGISEEELRKMVGYMQSSAQNLNSFTAELTEFISNSRANSRL